MTPVPAPADLGAYGLRLSGLDDAAAWMTPVRSPAGLLVRASVDPRVNDAPSELHDHSADLRLRAGGRLRVTSAPAEAAFAFAGPSLPPAADLLHPLLAPAAALTHIWAGREALHAGALAVGAGAVLLVGEPETGKSTTLALCATERDVGVLTDDLAIVQDGQVLAGPRCLDLREGSLLARAAAPGRVRAGTRVRLDLPAAPPAAPLAGVVSLGWGPRARLEPIAPAERLRALLAQRMFADHVAADLPAFVDMVALPMLTLERPLGEAGLHAGVDALLSYFA